MIAKPKVVRVIHGLPEDTRKLLAGLAMFVFGIAFLGVWMSFFSSRLVALAPGAPDSQDQLSAAAYPPVVQGTVREPSALELAQNETSPSASAPASPVEGIADTIRGVGQAVSGTGRAEPQSFLASLGLGARALLNEVGALVARTVSGFSDSLSHVVPPNL